MLNTQKINQVYNVILENGINNFSEKELIELLTIFTYKELDYFIENAYTKINNPIRIVKIEPLVRISIGKEILRIKNTNYLINFIESIKTGEQNELIKELNLKELSDIKKYFNYAATEETEEVSKKIINLVTTEIKNREENKKPCFN